MTNAPSSPAPKPAAHSATPPPARHAAEITAPDLASRLAATSPVRPLVLIDCREPDEWAIARIPGSTLIPLGTLLHNPADAAADLLDQHPDADIVIYCHHGVRSLRAALALRASGLTNALSLAGGIDHWSHTIDPSIPTY